MTLIIIRLKNGHGLIPLFLRTLQTLKINQDHTILIEHEAFGLMHQLVALVNAKLFLTNGAFASLSEICLADLSVLSQNVRHGDFKSLDPWLGDLKRVCEAAMVKFHYFEPRNSDPCSFCPPRERLSLDSAPVVPKGNSEKGISEEDD